MKGIRFGPNTRRITPRMIKCSKDMPNTKRWYRALLAVSIFAVSAGALSFASAKGKTIYESVTGDASSKSRELWDKKYATEQYIYGTQPSTFLVSVAGQIPVGRVLDIAMGEGRNAIYLAKKGFDVRGVDFSQVALRKARRWARKEKVTIEAINEDLKTYRIQPNHYDLIVNIHYLQRSLIPAIRAGVKKGGFVVFQNHTLEHLQNPTGAGTNRDFLLKKGELKRLFRGFKVLKYSETNDGENAYASLFAQKE